MTAEAIIRRVESYYGLQPYALTKSNRHRMVAHPRFVSWWLMRELTRMSFPDIGRLFHRDHSSIIHGVQWVEARIGAVVGFLEEIDSIVRNPDARAPTAMAQMVARIPEAFVTAEAA